MDMIFSRARHDFHWCGCGYLGVNGGFDYQKISLDSLHGAPNLAEPRIVEIVVDTTKDKLYNDWAIGADKYGIVSWSVK